MCRTFDSEVRFRPPETSHKESPPVLTPDLRHGFPGLLYLTFFLGHGPMVLGVIYATVVYELRPTLRSVARTVIATLAHMVLRDCATSSLTAKMLQLC